MESEVEVVKEEQSQDFSETPQNNGSAENPEVAGKTVNILGKSFTISDEALAEQLSQANAEYSQGIDRKFAERAEELGGLRQFRKEVLQREQEQRERADNQDAPVDYSSLLFEDTDRFVTEVVDKKLEKVKQDVARIAAEKEEAAFWDSMWEENQDLAKVPNAKDIVKMVGRKYSQYDLQNTKQVRDIIAADAKKWVKQVAAVKNSSDGFVEGASTQTVPAVKKANTPPPRRLLKDILTERKERKRKAFEERK